MPLFFWSKHKWQLCSNHCHVTSLILWYTLIIPTRSTNTHTLLHTHFSVHPQLILRFSSALQSELPCFHCSHGLWVIARLSQAICAGSHWLTHLGPGNTPIPTFPCIHYSICDLPPYCDSQGGNCEKRSRGMQIIWDISLKSSFIAVAQLKFVSSQIFSLVSDLQNHAVNWFGFKAEEQTSTANSNLNSPLRDTKALLSKSTQTRSFLVVKDTVGVGVLTVGLLCGHKHS